MIYVANNRSLNKRGRQLHVLTIAAETIEFYFQKREGEKKIDLLKFNKVYSIEITKFMNNPIDPYHHKDLDKDTYQNPIENKRFSYIQEREMFDKLN